MGLVDPNAPTQIDPAPSSQYDAYGNPIEPAHYAQPVQPRYVAPAPPVQPAQYMRPVEPVEPVGIHTTCSRSSRSRHYSPGKWCTRSRRR